MPKITCAWLCSSRGRKVRGVLCSSLVAPSPTYSKPLVPAGEIRSHFFATLFLPGTHLFSKKKTGACGPFGQSYPFRLSHRLPLFQRLPFGIILCGKIGKNILGDMVLIHCCVMGEGAFSAPHSPEQLEYLLTLISAQHFTVPTPISFFPHQFWLQGVCERLLALSPKERAGDKRCSRIDSP